MYYVIRNSCPPAPNRSGHPVGHPNCWSWKRPWMGAFIYCPCFTCTSTYARLQDGLPACLARPWTPKQPKLAQADLDYIAPETQLETSKIATVGCDVFSFGLLVCSVFNAGRSLIQAGYNPAVYMRHIDQVGRRIKLSLHSPSIIDKTCQSATAGILQEVTRRTWKITPPTVTLIPTLLVLHMCHYSVSQKIPPTVFWNFFQNG